MCRYQCFVTSQCVEAISAKLCPFLRQWLYMANEYCQRKNYLQGRFIFNTVHVNTSASNWLLVLTIWQVCTLTLWANWIFGYYSRPPTPGATPVICALSKSDPKPKCLAMSALILKGHYPASLTALTASDLPSAWVRPASPTSNSATCAGPHTSQHSSFTATWKMVVLLTRNGFSASWNPANTPAKPSAAWSDTSRQCTWRTPAGLTSATSAEWPTQTSTTCTTTPWAAMCVRRNSTATTVPSISVPRSWWRDTTSVLTSTSRFCAAVFVGRGSGRGSTWQFMRTSTRGRSCTSVSCVRKHSRRRTVWMFTWRSIRSLP